MSKEIKSILEKIRLQDHDHGEPITAASLASTTGENAQRRNVIKLNAREGKLKVVDYRSILEEIKADRKNDIKVDLSEWISSGKREIGTSSFEDENRTNGDGQNDERAQKRNALSEAFREGFEAGKNEAAKILRPEYEKKVQDIVRDFSSLIGEFPKEVEKYSREFDSVVVKLALAIAKRIVAREIEIDEGAVLARSREAIRKIVGVEKVKILVNSSDEEYIRQHRNELMSYVDSVKEIVIEGDNKVERGGCIIESDLGNIDARISTQFEIVEEALLSVTR